MKTLMHCIIGLIVAVAATGIPDTHSAPTGPPPTPGGVDPATYLGLEFVPIGHPLNNPDATGYGSVPYGYEIGMFEITEIQWKMFVDEVGRPMGLPTSAYSPQHYWGYDNLPITSVSWYEIAQFCNWLTTGDKFSGAYQFDASGAFLSIDRDAALDLYDAVYVMPSEDEWYKAAYFKPDASGYSLYAHGLDTDPIAGVDAVFDDTFPPDFDGVGSCNVEQSGTYDMMGLMMEWTESAWDGVLDDLSEDRVVRGGILDEAVIYLRSTFRFYTAPEDEWDGIGFRVVRLSNPYIEVSVDILPGSDVNPINLRSKGRVPVTILSDADFDASTIDPATVRFAHGPPVKYCLEDVDSDGDADLKLHFMTADLEIDPADTEAMLIGQTYDGALVVGTDTVKVVPKVAIHSKDELKIVSLSPSSPATLNLDERVWVKVKYQVDSAEWVRIFVRPYSDGRRTPGYGAHPSPKYEQGKGEMEGWFFFSDDDAVVDEIRVQMISPENEILAETIMPVNLVWTSD